MSTGNDTGVDTQEAKVWTEEDGTPPVGGVTRRKRGRPKGRPLTVEHRARIKAAMADGEAARRGWETRRRNVVSVIVADEKVNENEEARDGTRGE